jgi:formylglycine-generating enzyme required for sulfatase activity
VALKVIRRDRAADPHARERQRARFRREAEAVARVNHPHVVQIYEVGDSGGDAFLAMELVDGPSLQARLDRGGVLDPRGAAVLVEKAARAVQAVHDRGLLHRDLKPDNVLVTAGGEPKVGDFGLARPTDLAEGRTVAGVFVGTPEYSSPEQAALTGEDPTPAVDVYGLGAVLYACLTGRAPFPRGDLQTTLEKIRTQAVVPVRALRPEVPRDLQTVCLKCLEKDPRSRFPSATALADDLRRWLNGEPILARPVGPAERAWKWIKRNPGRAAALVATVLVLIGAGAAVETVRQQRETDRSDAERKRMADLEEADERAQQTQRERLAEAQVRALATANTAGVPRLIEDLAEVKNLARPRLIDLTAQPVGTKSGLHGRLALLGDEPARVAEVAGYVPTCRPDELLTIRDLLRPHSGAVAPTLWAVLNDPQGEPGSRARAACALAGLAPDDPQWGAVGAAVSDAVVRANPAEFVVWSQALDPVRAHLVPALIRRYPRTRRLIESGNLPVSELVAEATGLELTAYLLARYTADRPSDLAELAMTADARHHALFADAIRGPNRAAVVSRLRAELARTIDPDWQDPPLKAGWEPVSAATLSAIEGAQGMVRDRFAFVQTLPLEAFEPLAQALARSGYRPVRVRPYVADGRVRAGAVWKRDDVAWKFGSGLTAGEVRTRDDELRAAGFQPADVAAWLDPDAKPRPVEPLAAVMGGAGGWSAATAPVLRYAAVWELAPGGRATSKLYLGGAGTGGQVTEMTPLYKAGLLPKTVQAAGSPELGTWYSGVWGDVPDGSDSVSRLTASNYLLGKRGGVAVDCTFSATGQGNQYAGVWHPGLVVELEQPVDLTLGDHLTRARELAAGGWRPVALSVSASGTAASIWHRPAVPDAALRDLAKRQASAAAVLFTLGEVEPVWPLFAFPTGGDPGVRSQLLQRLGAIGADPALLVRRFGAETDVSARRALLIGLGDFQPESVPGPEREAFVARLLALYRDAPDAGLHSAIDWLLRQKWGKARELEALDAELAAAARARVAARAAGSISVPAFAGVPGAALGSRWPAAPVRRDRDWYVNGERQTFALVRDPREYTSGSPPTELERFTAVESPQRRRIGRSFAIATKEVTVEQFLRFRPDHFWERRYSPRADAPVVGVTWYDCAAYCNWLSEREGIPEDQWCYLPNAAGAYAPGMWLKPGHLSLTGYRLPTDAEWEYACRSGTVTSRYYGRDENLSPRYSWSLKNADDHAWPVGRLRPNDLGLFDALGNAEEWVDDSIFTGTMWQVEDADNPKLAFVLDSPTRLFRSGSFAYKPASLRSASRGESQPSAHNQTFGFRPARTHR